MASKVFALLVLFCAFTQARAETAESILSTAWRDGSYVLRKENSISFGTNRFSNPIEKAQLRLTQNAYADDRKAGLRVAPRGWTEYRLLSRLRTQQTQIETQAVADQLALALKARYDLLVDLRFANERLKTLRALTGVMKRELSMYAAGPGIGTAKDMIKVRSNLEDILSQTAEAESEAKSFWQRAHVMGAASGETLETPDWVAVPELTAHLSKLRSQLPANTDVTLPERFKAQQVRDALAYDIAKDDRLLDFIEVNFHQDGPEHRFGLELSFNIPGFAGGDYSSREKARDLVKYEIDAREMELEKQIRLHSTGVLLKATIERYQASASSEVDRRMQELQKLARRSDPLLASAFERERMERELRAQEAMRDAYKAYILDAETIGALALIPKTNILSRSLKELRQ